jgi:hypothetical protein
MADKDINIRVKAPGVDQVRQQINETAAALAKIPTLAQDINRSTDKAFAAGLETIKENATGASDGTKKLAADAGILSQAFSALKDHLTGLITGFAAFGAFRMARSLLQFFDDLKTKADEAVKKNMELRKSYEDLFEVMNQFTGKGRTETILQTEKLLAETATPAEVGKPAIEEYARQFGGQMKPEDYQAGIRQTLSYAARHGGAATPELIQLMRGFGKNTPTQQGDFMRMITATGGQAGMTDQEVVDTLGRSAPSSRAMGMAPEQTLAMIAALSAGEIGRNKTAMPATTIEAMANPNAEAIKKLGIAGASPNEIFTAVQQRSAGMSAQDKYKMLQSVYGDTGAKGVFKLMPGVAAITPVSPAADAAERAAYEQTPEGQQARTDAGNRIIDQDITSEERVMEQIRSIGKTNQARRRRRFPYQQRYSEMTTLKGGNALLEYAAFDLWKESLSPQQRAAYHKQFSEYSVQASSFGGIAEGPSSEEQAWGKMSPAQRLAELRSVNVSQNAAGGVSITNNNNTIFNQTPPGASPSISPEDTY